MTNECCVKGCNKEQGHHFPINTELRRQWALAVGQDRDWLPTRHSVVCEDHFVHTDFLVGPSAAGSLRRRKRCLKPEAVPSIFPVQSSEDDDEQPASTPVKRKLQPDGEVEKLTPHTEAGDLSSDENAKRLKESDGVDSSNEAATAETINQSDSEEPVSVRAQKYLDGLSRKYPRPPQPMISEEERKRRIRKRRARYKGLCVHLGEQFDRWTKLRNKLNTTNENVAKVLLDIYHRKKDEVVIVNRPCKCWCRYRRSPESSQPERKPASNPSAPVVTCPSTNVPSAAVSSTGPRTYVTLSSLSTSASIISSKPASSTGSGVSVTHSSLSTSTPIISRKPASIISRKPASSTGSEVPVLSAPAPSSASRTSALSTDQGGHVLLLRTPATASVSRTPAPSSASRTAVLPTGPGAPVLLLRTPAPSSASRTPVPSTEPGRRVLLLTTPAPSSASRTPAPSVDPGARVLLLRRPTPFNASAAGSNGTGAPVVLLNAPVPSSASGTRTPQGVTPRTCALPFNLRTPAPSVDPRTSAPPKPHRLIYSRDPMPQKRREVVVDKNGRIVIPLEDCVTRTDAGGAARLAKGVSAKKGDSAKRIWNTTTKRKANTKGKTKRITLHSHEAKIRLPQFLLNLQYQGKQKTAATNTSVHDAAKHAPFAQTATEPLETEEGDKGCSPSADFRMEFSSNNEEASQGDDSCVRDREQELMPSRLRAGSGNDTIHSLQSGETCRRDDEINWAPRFRGSSENETCELLQGGDDLGRVESEPGKTRTWNTSSVHEVEIKCEPEERVEDETTSLDAMQRKNRHDEHVRYSASSFDIVEVKTEAEDSVVYDSTVVDAGEIRTTPQEHFEDSASGFDAVQVKVELLTEDGESFYIVRAESESEDSVKDSD